MIKLLLAEFDKAVIIFHYIKGPFRSWIAFEKHKSDLKKLKGVC